MAVLPIVWHLFIVHVIITTFWFILTQIWFNINPQCIIIIFRTFLESEVMNNALRKDLYDKMIALEPNAPTQEEKQSQSITKLRYMQVRMSLIAGMYVTKLRYMQVWMSLIAGMYITKLRYMQVWMSLIAGMYILKLKYIWDSVIFYGMCFAWFSHILSLKRKKMSKVLFINF